jgi:hypothetical protein
MDLGPCPRLHSEKVAKSYKEAKLADPLDPRFAAFEQEYQNSIYNFIDDCDRKIRISQKRLEKTPEENKRTVDLMKEVGEIELAIQGSTDEVEALGEAGKIEESMAKLEAVEALKQEKTDKERELQRLTETGGASGHQKLRVCETCGAYLSVLDSDRRLADHFGGKVSPKAVHSMSSSSSSADFQYLIFSLIARCTWVTTNSESSSINSTNNVVKVKPPGTDLLLSPPAPEDHLLPATTISPRLPDRPVPEATTNNRILPRRILTDRLALSRPSCPTTETRSYLATGTRGNERLTNCRMPSGRTKRGESPRGSGTVKMCFP